MAIFLIALILSAIVGALRGTIPMPTGALLYCAQWAHLMLLFVAAYSLGVKLGTAGIYAWGLGGVSIAMLIVLWFPRLKYVTLPGLGAS